MARPLRVSLTLSGGASLGAYQAGVVAALLVAFGHAREHEEVEIDVLAIGGASAGSLVAMLAAHSLLEGIDGPTLLNKAWVEDVSLPMLMRGPADGPLSLEGVREHAPELLRVREGPKAPRQECPLTLHVALTGLRGLTYEIPGVRHGKPALGSTYADWAQFELQPGGGIEQMVSPKGSAPLDIVLTSASHPGAFPPRLLDRSDLREAYADQGIVDFPEGGSLWYSDGGLIQSEPLGRVIGAARHSEDPGSDARHLTLMIDSRSEEPSGASDWSDPDHQAEWVRALARALAIFPAQQLYDDLRRVERDNRRLQWVAELTEAIAPALDTDAKGRVREALEEISAQRAEMRAGSSKEVHELPGEEASSEELLGRVLSDIAGVTGKREVSVDVISPMVLARERDENVPDLLAGEMLGDFAGFLDEDLRRSDFSLGYECAISWGREGLVELGFDDAVVERTIEAMEDRRLYDFEEVRLGSAGVGDVPWRARLRLSQMLVRAARSLVRPRIGVPSVLPAVDRIRRRLL